MLLSGGAACALLYLLVPFAYDGPDLLTTNLTLASLAAIGLTLGFSLVYQARNFLRGRPSGVFDPPSPWKLAALFVISLAIGQLALSALPSIRLTSLVFPPLHVLAATTPALTILAFAGRRTKAASWRTISLEVSHGSIIAPTVALTAELIVVLALVFAASLAVVLMPGGAEKLIELSSQLQDPNWLEDPNNLAQLVLSPAMVAGIVLVFVFAAPLIEEFVKGFGVLLLGFRLTGRAEALLWGVACGAGFALGESLFNGSVVLEGWAIVMPVRWGASLMHCVASGLMGIGWYEALALKRPARLLAAYAGSAGIHAFWNALAVGVALPSLFLATSPDNVSARTIAALIIAGGIGLLVLLTASLILLMAMEVRRVRAYSRASSLCKEVTVNEESP
jgi:RsiW-degrading membrane proteinase PrsW (M82 family)